MNATLILFRSFALIGSAIWAGTASGRKASKWLLAYFAAQVITDLVLLAYWFRVESEAYAALFTVLTFAILAASAGYTFECFRDHARKLRWVAAIEAVVLPVFLANIAYLFLRDTIPFLKELYPGQRYQGVTIALGECGALLAMGIGLGTAAMVTPRAFTPRILALLWLCLGAWEYSFALGIVHAEKLFRNLNQWLPAAIVVVFFFIFGCVGRLRIPADV